MDGYYAFMLVATAFVLMMTVPALALFYGGMSRSKSVLNMMMMSYVAAAIVGILYVAVGWSMGFGGEGTFFANPFELLWLDGVTTDAYIDLIERLSDGGCIFGGGQLNAIFRLIHAAGLDQACVR